MITLEREHERARGVRPSVSAVIFDRRTVVPRETLALDWFSPRRLPPNLLPNHRIRLRDAGFR